MICGHEKRDDHSKWHHENYYRGEKRGTGYFSSLDIFWLRDESLEDSDNLPDPDVLAQEIVDDLEAAQRRRQDAKRRC